MRLRIRFTKTGKIRWTSHRDLARMWERAFRRTELPLAYSVGFSPRPKVSFGLALSTGHESIAEYLDIELDDQRSSGVDLADLPARLTEALPPGIDVVTAAILPAGADSLQHEVSSCGYDLVVTGASEAEMRALVEATLSASAVMVTRERKGRSVTDDVRPGIIALDVLGPASIDGGTPGVRLAAELATQPRGLRPAELLLALASFSSPAETVLEEARVCRTHQWISRADGAREEPLALPQDAVVVAPPVPLERAS